MAPSKSCTLAPPIPDVWSPNLTLGLLQGCPSSVRDETTFNNMSKGHALDGTHN
jgi:hypothetical protein